MWRQQQQIQIELRQVSDCEAQLHFHTHKMPQLLARLSAIVIFFIIILIFSVPSLCPVYGVPVHTLSLRSFDFLLFFLCSLLLFYSRPISTRSQLITTDRLFIFLLENLI